MKKYLLECERKYKKLGKKASKEQVLGYSRYFKTPTRYQFYDIKRTTYRELPQALSFQSFSDKEQDKIWSYIFKNTSYLDLGDLAIFYFKNKFKKNRSIAREWPLLKTWATQIDNWIHGDMLASLYVEAFNEESTQVFPVLQKWSTHKNPWMRRMGLLSPLYYYQERRVLPKFTALEKMITPNLKHPHYYLQKAVGWTIREMTSAYPIQSWNFQKKYNTQISSVAFSTSVERTETKKKERLKEERREFRASKRS